MQRYSKQFNRFQYSSTNFCTLLFLVCLRMFTRSHDGTCGGATPVHRPEAAARRCAPLFACVSRCELSDRRLHYVLHACSYILIQLSSVTPRACDIVRHHYHSKASCDHALTMLSFLAQGHHMQEWLAMTVPEQRQYIYLI